MQIKFIILSLICFGLISCIAPRPPAMNTLDQTDSALAEASYSVSRSLVDLSETAQAAHPLPKLNPPPNPASYGMGGLTTIDWSGPVEPLVRQIAKQAEYGVRVLGTAPAIPVLVTLYDKNIALGDALRNVGFQCGRRATIVIFPDRRIIELRYAKN